MHIENNYQGIMQIFSKMNGGKSNTSMPFSSGTLTRRSGTDGRNTLEDLLSGHYKNSYGVEGMVITEGSNRNRIMPVSEEMKQHVFNCVKEAFYKYNGMSNDNEAEQRNHYGKINAYLKTIKKEDRSATSWTLEQLSVSIANKVSSDVKEKVPGWTYGEPIPSNVLDEIFADESITSMVSGKFEGTKGIDLQV